MWKALSPHFQRCFGQNGTRSHVTPPDWPEQQPRVLLQLPNWQPAPLSKLPAQSRECNSTPGHREGRREMFGPIFCVFASLCLVSVPHFAIVPRDFWLLPHTLRFDPHVVWVFAPHFAIVPRVSWFLHHILRCCLVVFWFVQHIVRVSLVMFGFCSTIFGEA